MEYKAPNEKFDFVVDWVTTLSGATITTSAWTVPAGLTNESESNDTQTATLRVSGGTAGVTYKVVNEITANNGDVFERVWFLRIRERLVA